MSAMRASGANRTNARGGGAPTDRSRVRGSFVLNDAVWNAAFWFFISTAPITRALGPEAPPLRALVRFAPDARIADITALLDTYQASIIDGAKGGLFRLQFANRAMGRDEFAGLMRKLQNEKIVSLAVDAQ